MLDCILSIVMYGCPSSACLPSVKAWTSLMFGHRSASKRAGGSCGPLNSGEANPKPWIYISRLQVLNFGLGWWGTSSQAGRSWRHRSSHGIALLEIHSLLWLDHRSVFCLRSLSAVVSTVALWWLESYGSVLHRHAYVCMQFSVTLT